ncbi:HesA/MoeB/ThiF family protein [Streptomyces sp. NPDC004069]
MNTPVHSLEEQPRYARHALVAGWDQQRIGDATVLLLGIGALGNVVAQTLALAGVGRLLLCDPDVVEASNLSRCPLFTAADVGRPKAEAAADALHRLAPDVRTEVRAAPLLSGVGLAELRDAQLVVGCLDSRTARLELATRCNLVGAALLDGGTHEWGGQVTSFVPGGRCWGCGLDAAELTVQDSPWSCSVPRTRLPVGATAPVSFLVGSWLASHAVRLLLGLPVEHRPLRIDSFGTADPVDPPGPMDRPQPDCPLHERIDPAEVTALPFGADAPVGALVKAVDPDEEPLAWAGFRRVDGGWHPLATTFRLRAAHPDTALSALGVAPRELLGVVQPGRSRPRYVELATALRPYREAPA